MSRSGSGQKNKRQWLGRTFGSGFDEISFYLISTWRGWQRRTPYMSDAAEMLALQELTQAEPSQLFVPPPSPDVSIQNQQNAYCLAPPGPQLSLYPPDLSKCGYNWQHEQRYSSRSSFVSARPQKWPKLCCTCTARAQFQRSPA